MKQYVIYAILNKLNKKMYIGSTINYKERKKSHLSSLRKGTHRNNHLQDSFNQYGDNNFMFIKLEEGAYTFPYTKLLEIEDSWVCIHDSINPEKGYNKMRPKDQMYLQYATRLSKDGHENYLLTRGPVGLKNMAMEEWIAKRMENPNFKNVYQKNGLLLQPVRQIDPLTFQVLNTFQSLIDAQNSTGVRYTRISDCINTNTFGREYLTKASGFIWVAEDNFPKDFDFTIYKGKKRPHSGGRISKPKPTTTPKSKISIHNEAGEVREFGTDKEIADFLGVNPVRIAELKRGYKDKGGGRQSRILQVKGWQWGSVPSLHMA